MSKVLRFKEFVNERLFNSGVKRASANTLREEDKLQNSNLYDLKPVDMGFDNIVFADQDLEVNEEKYFNEEKWSKIEDLVRLTGWRLPTTDDMSTSFFKDYSLVNGLYLETNKDDKSIHLCSEIGGEKQELIFPVQSLDMSAIPVVAPVPPDKGWRSLNLNPIYIKKGHEHLAIALKYMGEWRKGLRVRLVKDKKQK